MTTVRAPSAAVTANSATVWRLVLFTGVAFGSASLLSKALVDDGVDPFMVTWLPFLAGGLFGLAVAKRRGELTAAAVVPGAVLGVMSSAVPALLFNVGFETLPAGIVTLFISMAPVFTALIAHFVFDDERFNLVKGAGLVLAVAGITLLAFGPGSTDGDGSSRAMALVLVGAVIAGAAAVMTRVYALGHGAVALIAPQLTAAGVMALILTPVLGRSFSPPQGFAPWHIPSMVALGVVTSYFGFRSMLRASEIGTTGQVSIISYMIPLFGVIGGVVIFDDRISAGLVAGGFLIIVAVTVINRGSQVASRGLPSAGLTSSQG